MLFSLGLCLIIVSLITGSIAIFGNLNPLNTQTENNTFANQTKVMNYTELENQFKNTANLDYSKYKCREKSDIFAQWIHLNDDTAKVYTVSVTHKSGEYCHVYVLYNDMVYDPTCEPAIYNMTQNKYQKQLIKWGFTGYVVKSGYGG